jgi:short-subunit dehydrogenase
VRGVVINNLAATRLAAHSFEKYPSQDACIVLTGSIASYLGPQAISVYAASKHGVSPYPPLLSLSLSLSFPFLSISAFFASS